MLNPHLLIRNSIARSAVVPSVSGPQRCGPSVVAGLPTEPHGATVGLPRRSGNVSANSRWLYCVLALVTMLASITASAVACPFCTAVSQTFSEEMQSMDIVLFAELIEVPDDDDEDATGELPRCKFKVTEVLNGEAWYAQDDTIEVHYFGPNSEGGTFLIMGTDPPQTMWGTPLIVKQRAQAYLKELPLLPTGNERLEFFIDYLEDEDELLARDAYDEFAKTPYDGVIALKDSMDHDQLVGFIRNPDTPPSRRRLYLTMLGVCGNQDDCEMLETMMQSDNREDKAGLNALIACYLSLAKAEGLPLIEELFLANQDAEYQDTYAAIMALRFHGNDHDVIPREKLLPGLRAVLDRPDLADLVIPDLARWEDWEVMPRLIALFEEADEESNWVRVPVVNFLRACPLDEAKLAIEDLKQIDPEAVERAESFFPYTQFAGPARNEDDTTAAAEGETQPTDAAPQPDELLAARQAVTPKTAPRDRTIYEAAEEEEPGFNWMPTAFFGALLVIALLLKLATGAATATAGVQSPADEEAVR